MNFSPDNIYEFIRTDDRHETEFRYKFSKEDIITFLASNRNKFASKCELEQTVNIIYVDKSKDRRDFIISKNYETNRISYNIKKKEMTIKLSSSIFLNVSKEIPSTEHNKPRITETFLTRIKNRLTIPYENGKFDVTQVAEIRDTSSARGQAIENRRTDLFTPMKGYKEPEEIYDAFIQNMGNSVISSVELEFEFTDPKPGDLTVEFAINILGKSYSEGVIKSGILAEVALDIGSRGTTLKSILNNASCLTTSLYNRIYPPIDWYITPKADGFIGLVIINKMGKSYIVYSTQIDEIQGLEMQSGYTLIVGEVVDKIFYAFDSLIINDEKVFQQPFSKRHELTTLFLSEPIKFGEYKLVAKDHIRITEDLQRSFKSIIEMPKEYEIDGYIMVSPNNSYTETLNYKIKEHNTIDFLVIECPPSLAKEDLYKNSKKDGATFLLFCTIGEQQLKKALIQPIKGYTTIFPRRFYGTMPIQFCPADNPLAYIWFTSAQETKILRVAQTKGRIIAELNYLPKTDDWALIKIREDRIDEPNYYGNHLFKVAEQSWFATKYPFRIQDMANPLTNYFGTGKSDIYKAQTGFNSYVKSRLLSQATTMVPSKTAIDLAAGKGQDLGRYYDNQYSRVVFCDIDPVALSELVTRRFDMIRDNRKKGEMAIQTLHRDLTAPAEDTIEILKPLTRESNVGLIVCNFAIHYLITDIDKLNNFIKLVRGLVTQGTIFYFTTMSGAAVVDTLGSADEWKIHENGIIKYRIMKKYSGSTLADMGQTIKTKLPFSDELYEENLVNIDFVNKQFIKYGFKLIASESFSVFLNQFKTDNSPVYSLLTPDDKKYLSLYQYSMFEC